MNKQPEYEVSVYNRSPADPTEKQEQFEIESPHKNARKKMNRINK